MKLKTYRAPSMADVLTAVKKDLGREAVILHTRTIKAGGFFGFRKRTLVEVTASDQPPAAMRRSGGVSATFGAERTEADSETKARPEPKPVVSAAAAAGLYSRAAGASAPEMPRPTPATVSTVSVAPLVPRPDEPQTMTVRERRSAGASAVAMSEPLAPAAIAERVGDRGRPNELGGNPETIRRELADIKLLVTQVLQSSTPTPTDLGCGRMPEALFKHYLRLLESQVSRDIADRLVGRVRDELNAGELGDESIVRSAVLRHLSDLIPIAEAPAPVRNQDGRPHVIALVGPTGVGKTTTIAKLAATYRLRQGRSVALITADTYRIAAVDQLRTYASIIGLPLKVVLTPAEMSAAVEALSGHDVVLVDTAGRSQRNTERLSELSEFLAAARPTETHLVLSTAAAQEVLLNATDAFAMLRPNRVILTKLDEAVNFGVVVNVMQRLQSRLSFVTTGQEVPDHIEPGRAERLARLILEPESAPEATGRPVHGDGPLDRAGRTIGPLMGVPA